MHLGFSRTLVTGIAAQSIHICAADNDMAIKLALSGWGITNLLEWSPGKPGASEIANSTTIRSLFALTN